MNGRPSESLDTIAGWSAENESAVEMTRQNVKRLIKAWNISGGKIVLDVLGPDAVGHGEGDFQNTEDYLGFTAQYEGIVGLLTVGWDGATPGSSATQPVKEYWTYISAIIEQLNQGAHGAAPVSYTHLTLPTICSV